MPSANATAEVVASSLGAGVARNSTDKRGVLSRARKRGGAWRRARHATAASKRGTLVIGRIVAHEALLVECQRAASISEIGC
jgi:hypothetical protein